MNSIDLVKDSTMHDIAVSLRVLSGSSISDIATMSDLQRFVAAGKAPQVISVGDKIKVHNSVFGDIYFNVLGFDMEELVDGSKTHSMTIQPERTIGNSSFYAGQFDAAEITSATGTYRSNLYYYRVDSSVVSGYKLLTMGVDYTVGTTISGTVYSNTICDPTGYIIKNGCDIWGHSGMRQWLNSNKAAGSWWTAAHTGDVKPAYADTVAGFLSGFDEEFQNSIAKVRKTTLKNRVITNQINEVTEDYFFLLSKSEVGAAEPGAEGAMYPYFANDVSRIKQRGDNGNIIGWYLRTANPGDSHQVSRVHTTGECNDSSKVSVSYGICPACVIA